MPKILIYLAVWRRPEITEICFLGINRLKNFSREKIDAFAVISEESMIPLCEKYGVKWVMHENLPLGRKKNYGLKEALKLEWDYLLELGSDDLLKNEVLELYEPHLNFDVIGMTNFCFINTQNLDCKMYNSRSSFGLGRLIKRSVAEKLGALWADKLSIGLDNNSKFSIARAGFVEKRIFSNHPLAIDLKSDVNIWAFDKMPGVNYNLEDALNGLSEEEINAIKCLAIKKKSESLIEE